MSNEIEACALALLKADPEYAVPLSRLYQELVAEAGPGVGGRSQLRERIRRRPDLFLLLETADAPWSTAEWPPELSREYHEALRDAGLAPEPRVAPVTAGIPMESDDRADGTTLLRRVNASLVDLWNATAGDPETQAKIADTLERMSGLRAALASPADGAAIQQRAEPRRGRPTTPPRGPRSGA